MEKVFGVGWAKTGTTSLGTCFEILGYNHQTQRLDLTKHLGNNDLAPIMKVANKKDTFEDWPWLLLYKEFDKQFPESKFILTKRAPEKWVKSYKNMLEGQGSATEELNEIRRILYGLPFPEVSEEQLIKRYTQHNDDVIHYFKDRPEDLLIVDWSEGDGWKEICDFLGKKVPNIVFPHSNQGTYTKAPLIRKLRITIKEWLQ